MNADFSPYVNRLPATEVPVENVTLAPGPFTMSYGFNLDFLKASVEGAGLLNPPILLESGAGDLLIVSGYRRISALVELGRTHFPARVLEANKIHHLDALLINFFDNLATREFNPVEKGMILGRLAEYLSVEQILDFYMSLLGLPPRKSTLENYISFDRVLDEILKRSLLDGTISEATARALLGRSKEERQAMSGLFTKVTFNMNQQKQLLELLTDTSRISGVSIAEMIQSEPFADILDSASMNRPQKARAILLLLRSMRFPRLTRADEVFKKRVAKLHLPQEVQIKASPYFESEFYRMEISFRNGRQLKDLINQLVNIDGLQEMQDPWEGAE